MNIDIDDIPRVKFGYCKHTVKEALEQQQKEIEGLKTLTRNQAMIHDIHIDDINARDEVIKGLIFECSTIGYDDAIIKKAEKLINWELE